MTERYINTDNVCRDIPGIDIPEVGITRGFSHSKKILALDTQVIYRLGI